tara:strand:- start:38 stop:148 length:111 start_codon:yes stop_codon:yes gene_type:complete
VLLGLKVLVVVLDPLALLGLLAPPDLLVLLEQLDYL